MRFGIFTKFAQPIVDDGIDPNVEADRANERISIANVLQLIDRQIENVIVGISQNLGEQPSRGACHMLKHGNCPLSEHLAQIAA